MVILHINLNAHIFYFPISFTGELRNISFLQNNDSIFWFIWCDDLLGRLVFVAKPCFKFVKIDEANVSSVQRPDFLST